MKAEVLIVAGEASGDLHGSRLVRAMRSRNPDLHFAGVGGTELAAAGVDILVSSSQIAVVGFFEVISHLSALVSAQKSLRRYLEDQRPALLILIDFPDFNLLLARKAKQLGIPIFYYISPQVWAWRSGRVKTMARLIDRIGVILPFEEEFYRLRGVAASYVGHPLLDSVQAELPREQFCDRFDIDPTRRLIGILPGSRRKEVLQLLPVFLAAAARYQAQNDDHPVFLIPQAPTVSREELMANGIADYAATLDLRIVSSHRYSLMAACDAAVAASGTVTLELLLLGTPTVVAYKLSPWTYRLGTMLVNIPHFSLVNLIAGQEVITELLQDEVEEARIASELWRLLHDNRHRWLVRRGYADVRMKLGTPGASGRAADLAMALIDNR